MIIGPYASLHAPKFNTFISPATYEYPLPNRVLSVTEQGTR